MDITFKYVGQGDTIVIEWEVDGEPCVGVIDCKSLSDRVPALDHIRGYERIEFLILSHPHADHFSGFPRLLRFCKTEQVEIGLFVYTTREIPSYLESLALSNNEKDDLADTFRAVRELEKEGLVEKRGIGTDQMRDLSLKSSVRFRLLAPSEQERDEFAKSLYGDYLEIRDDPDANLISTVSLVEGNDWQIILTSDAETHVLKRIGLGPLKKDYTPLILGQCPHHGSDNNHYRAFWKNRDHESDTPIAISVGPNGYGHPSPNVVQDFRNMNFEVYSTWQRTDSAAEDIRADLNLISEDGLENSGERSGRRDLRFTIDIETGRVECTA